MKYRDVVPGVWLCSDRYWFVEFSHSPVSQSPLPGLHDWGGMNLVSCLQSLHVYSYNSRGMLAPPTQSPLFGGGDGVHGCVRTMIATPF